MHKIIAIILLILHVNTSMFIPVAGQLDMFNTRGVVVDDVNSVYELVDQVLLGNEDRSKDTDSERHENYFGAVNLMIFIAPESQLTPIHTAPATISWVVKPDYIFRPEDKWTSVTHEIIVPPPKA